MDQQQSNQPQTSDPGGVLPPVQLPGAVDEASSNLPPASVPPQLNMPIQDAAPQTVPMQRALVHAPESAEDSDLIEKEWVEKAKQIVAHTANDPFTQQEELSKMKADYMKKRYNKDIGS